MIAPPPFDGFFQRAVTETAESLVEPDEAVQAIVGSEPPPYDVLVCGSLYLVGHLLRDHA